MRNSNFNTASTKFSLLCCVIKSNNTCYTRVSNTTIFYT